MLTALRRRALGERERESLDFPRRFLTERGRQEYPSPMCSTGASTASLIAAIAASTGVVIAVINSWAQRRQHAERMRLDLYDRRVATLNSILSYYDAVLLWSDTPEQKLARDSFLRAYLQSEFLFKKKSGIPALFKQFYEEGNKVIAFKQSQETLRAAPTVNAKLFEEDDAIPGCFRSIEVGSSKIPKFSRLALHR